jgi:hypothetical protein
MVTQRTAATNLGEVGIWLDPYMVKHVRYVGQMLCENDIIQYVKI